MGREKTLSLIMFLFGMFFLVMTLQIPSTKSQLFDSRFMPLLMSIFLLLISISRFIRFRNEEAEEKGKIDYKTLFTTIGLLVVYIFIYSRLGFVVASGLFIFFEILNLKPTYIEFSSKKLILLASFCIIFPVIVYYLFYFGFRIILPAGILQGIL